jgi:HK97 gp10 family phage protein
MAEVIRIKGLDELRAALADLSPTLRRRLLRNALSAGARIFRDDAKRLAPVLSLPVQSGGKLVRKPGTLRNAISIRSSKVARANGQVGLFINVRPAKGVNRGAKSPSDPFYWRFVEFGTRKMPAKPFLRPAAAGKFGDAVKAFEASIGPAIQRLNRPR